MCSLSIRRLALITMALLMIYAPADQYQRRRFDIIGAAILAAALAVLTWALSQIGPQSTGRGERIFSRGSGSLRHRRACRLCRVGKRKPQSDDAAMAHRAIASFVALNVATVLTYASLAIMFFLLSFDLIDRRHLSPTHAGLAFLPFTLGVGILSRPFGSLADKIGARVMLIIGPLGASLAYILLALGKGAPLALGVLIPMTATRHFLCDYWWHH